jgi:Zn-dependent protease with chaperone function
LVRTYREVPDVKYSNVRYHLTGAIEPTRLSQGYRVGLLIVAITMLVLPLIYLGLIAVVGVTVYWHLNANAWIMTGRAGGVWRLVGYFGPAVAGLVLMFFMVKPVLARPARRADPLPIEAEDAPALFGLIDQICQQVRAPRPGRVQVDCQVNASAGFASLPLGVRRPNLVLTIGLPLSAGLTVRQLGGVLAHEFGHFSQGGGMRLTFIVRSINAWFARVVNERDEWDDALERWSSSGNWMIVLTMNVAKASVWCSRHILGLLMTAGHGISCFMLRQMEHDADSYEIKVVGSATFLETSARMRELNLIAHLGYNDLRDSWIRRTLPANLPAFLVRQGARVPDDVVTQVREIPRAETSVFDTHPSDRDRARAAERAAAAGILVGGDDPSTVLFNDFDAVSAAATRHHYELDLGVSLESLTLVETEAAVSASRDREGNQRSAEAFFGDRMSVYRPLRLSLPGEFECTSLSIISDLKAARRTMHALGAGVAAMYRRFESLEQTRNLAVTALELLDAGFTKVIPADFELTDGTREDAQATASRAVEQQEDMSRDLLRFETAACNRLSYGLALSTGTRRDDANRFVGAVNALADVWDDMNELHRLLVILEHMLGNTSKSPKPGLAASRLKRTRGRIESLLDDISRKLGETSAPSDGSIVRLVDLLGIPEALKAEEEARRVLVSAAAARYDLIGRLAAIALETERGIDERAGQSVQPVR